MRQLSKGSVLWENFRYDAAEPPRPTRAAQDRAATHRTGEKAANFGKASTDRLWTVCDRHSTPASFFLDIAHARGREKRLGRFQSRAEHS